MLNLDPGKLLIVGVVAIILLGPDRLPQVAGQVGGTWRSFSDFRSRMEAEVRSNIPDLPSTSELTTLVRSPSALLHRLSDVGSDHSAAGLAFEGAEPTSTPETLVSDLAPQEGAMSWVTRDFDAETPPTWAAPITNGEGPSQVTLHDDLAPVHVADPALN